MKIINLILISLVLSCRYSSAQALCLNISSLTPQSSLIPFQKCSADLNGDGQLDFVIPSVNSFTSISIILSNGVNSYASAIQHSTGTMPCHVECSDFDNDGKQDILCVSNTGNEVAILKGNGLGAFTSFTNFPVAPSPESGRCKDLNSDGKIDAVVVSENSLSLLINNGSGGFLGALYYPTSLGTEPKLILEDFDNDGKPDVFAYNQTNSSMFKNLSGTLQSINSSTYNFNYQYNHKDANQVLSFDLNNDSNMDLIGISNQSLAVYYGNGNFTFSSPTLYPSGITMFQLISLSKGDVNSDGLTDVVAVNFVDTLCVLLNNGTGGFSNPVKYYIQPILYPISYSKHVEVKDIDGNGKLDIVVSKDNTGDLAIFFNCNMVGQAEHSKETSLNIYPNPSEGSFNIDSESPIINIEARDIHGKLVAIRYENNKLDIGQVRSGIYLIRIKTANKGFFNYKLIITN